MNSQIKTVLNTHAGYGITVLRIIVGVLLMAHGSQKLFGFFGGYGLEGTGQYMASLGLNPGYLMALMSGSAEFFGGLALFLGLLARPAALVVTIMLVVAIFSVHIHNGLFMANNGYEYALALTAASIAILIEGAGRFSLDRAIVK